MWILGPRLKELFEHTSVDVMNSGFLQTRHEIKGRLQTGSVRFNPFIDLVTNSLQTATRVAL